MKNKKDVLLKDVLELKNGELYQMFANGTGIDVDVFKNIEKYLFDGELLGGK